MGNAESSTNSSDDKKTPPVSSPPPRKEEVVEKVNGHEAEKKTIQWQSQKGVKSSNGVGGGTSSHSNETPSVSSSFDERSTKEGLPGFFGFLFSPPGIILMFVAVNYPWIKTLVFGSSSSSATASTTGTAR